MKLAVCLMTADRVTYTFRTLQTFFEMNPGARNELILLHADDASETSENMAIAGGFGFETVYRSEVRRGAGPALAAMWAEALRRGADRILHLENDQEWVKPIPDIEALGLQRFACVRLYGAHKMRDATHERSPSGTRDLATGRTVTWYPLGVQAPGWEAGFIHWGGQPSITTGALLVNAAKDAKRLKDITLGLSCPTARPTENITWHMGDVTTPGGIH